MNKYLCLNSREKVASGRLGWHKFLGLTKKYPWVVVFIAPSTTSVGYEPAPSGLRSCGVLEWPQGHTCIAATYDVIPALYLQQVTKLTSDRQMDGCTAERCHWVWPFPHVLRSISLRQRRCQCQCGKPALWLLNLTHVRRDSNLSP